MRVLTVGNLYPPHHFGGYEQVWRSAVAHLRRAGHETQVLCTGFRHPGVPDGDEPGVDRALRWYWRDHDFARFDLRDRVRIERRNHAALRRHLRALRPDVVSFWSMGGMSHSLIEAVRRQGLPIALFVHDEWFDYGRFTDQWTRLFHARSRWLLGGLAHRFTGIPTSVDYVRAGRWVFVSEYVRGRALRIHPALRDTAVAHSGIDPALLEDGGTAPARPWAWDLLYVGRLHPDKGILEAVEALTHLPEEATLTFAGAWDPRDEDALGARAAQLGVADRVTMLGHVPAEDIGGLYRRHDAVLFPVIWQEPWGLVPLEAMASGCPVVATGRGGSGEYLRDGENCVLVAAGDPESLAAGIRRLAASPELWERLRAGGRETAPRHTAPIFDAAVEHHLAAVAA